MLVGAGVGGVPQSVTLYSEFLPKQARGRCIMMIEVFWAIGTCAEVILGKSKTFFLWLCRLQNIRLWFFSGATQIRFW